MVSGVLGSSRKWQQNASGDCPARTHRALGARLGSWQLCSPVAHSYSLSAVDFSLGLGWPCSLGHSELTIKITSCAVSLLEGPWTVPGGQEVLVFLCAAENRGREAARGSESRHGFLRARIPSLLGILLGIIRGF